MRSLTDCFKLLTNVFLFILCFKVGDTDFRVSGCRLSVVGEIHKIVSANKTFNCFTDCFIVAFSRHNFFMDVIWDANMPVSIRTQR